MTDIDSDSGGRRRRRGGGAGKEVAEKWEFRKVAFRNFPRENCISRQRHAIIEHGCRARFLIS